MNIEVIITSLITACFPALFAYLKASADSKLRMQELEKRHLQNQENLKLEYELKLKEKEADSQNELVTKFFTGDINTSEIGKTFNELSQLTKQLEGLK